MPGAPPATPVTPPVRNGADPSALTNQALLREIYLLREIIETRLDGMDKAILLLQAYPTEVDRKVGQLKELMLEMFKSVGDLFAEKEKAVAAAFQATEKAVDKNESAFSKQIESVNERIDDMKERVLRREGRETGVGQSWANVVSIILLGMALLGGLGTIVVMLGNS